MHSKRCTRLRIWQWNPIGNTAASASINPMTPQSNTGLADEQMHCTSPTDLHSTEQCLWLHVNRTSTSSSSSFILLRFDYVSPSPASRRAHFQSQTTTQQPCAHLAYRSFDNLTAKNPGIIHDVFNLLETFVRTLTSVQTRPRHIAPRNTPARAVRAGQIAEKENKNMSTKTTTTDQENTYYQSRTQRSRDM